MGKAHGGRYVVKGNGELEEVEGPRLTAKRRNITETKKKQENRRNKDVVNDADKTGIKKGKG